MRDILLINTEDKTADKIADAPFTVSYNTDCISYAEKAGFYVSLVKKVGENGLALVRLDIKTNLLTQIG